MIHPQVSACLRSEPFRAQMLQCARLTLKTEADAEDLIQQIALEAIQKSERMGHIDQPESWLWHFYRFAHRDFVRARARQRRRSGEWLTEPVSPQNVERDLIEKEDKAHQLRHVQERFARLTPRQQQVIRMLYVEDRNGKEIAATLGITYKAFRMAKDGALSHLRTK